MPKKGRQGGLERFWGLVARWVLGRFEKGKEKPLEALEEGVCRGFLVFGGKRGEDRGSWGRD
jgi:hypothetical protein